LEDRGKQSALTEEDEWELARLTADMEGDEAAIPLLRCLLEKSDRHVSANFELGRILLARSDEAGLHHLGLAMQDDPQCTIAASFYAEQFCREQGRIEDADRYRNRAIELAELRDEADRERANVSPNDIFREHGVDSEVVLQLREHLRRYPNLKEAFLVRKEVRTFPDEHAFVLGIVPSGTWFRSSPNEADMQLLDQVAGNAPMPRGTYVVLLNSANRKLRKRIGMPGASVFRR
jgi:tetratricopeptide (TPR) repeat protein